MLTGKTILEPGWRKIFAGERTENDEEQGENRILPDFVKGESGPHEPALQKKATQPPKYYTEGTLLRAMESAGKTVDDEELREAMKENGIDVVIGNNQKKQIVEILEQHMHGVENKRLEIAKENTFIPLMRV